MRRWTNEKWLSTLHQVVIPNLEISVDNSSEKVITKRRQSIAFFHNLNKDAEVKVLVKDELNEIPKYEPIIAGDFLMQKHLAATSIGKY